MRKLLFAALPLFLALAVTGGCNRKDEQAQHTMNHVAPVAQDAVVEPDSTISQADQAIALQAVELFKTACPLLKTGWKDVYAAKVTLRPVNPAMKDQVGYGWKRVVDFRVVMKEKTRHIPTDIRAAGRMAVFTMGGGNQPGVYVKTEVAQGLCRVEDFPMPYGILIPVKGMEIVK